MNFNPRLGSITLDFDRHPIELCLKQVTKAVKMATTAPQVYISGSRNMVRLLTTPTSLILLHQIKLPLRVPGM